MKNYLSSNQIEKELDKIKIDSHWDDETIIEYYKKKTREICARLEEEEKIKRKDLLLNNNKNFIIKNTNNAQSQKLKRNSSSFREQNTNNKSKLDRPSFHNRIGSAKPKIVKKIEENESVLNMLFPYVNENDFKIEPFKSGADLRKEKRKKNSNIPVIKVNQERRIKSNFLEKFKKYDKELNTYADNPSIRRSSAYATEEQIRRREFIESKKLWVTTADFRRVVGKMSENERIKEQLKNETHIPDKYVEPSILGICRTFDKSKWISKKNFIV